jgi:hypothetical protein
MNARVIAAARPTPTEFRPEGAFGIESPGANGFTETTGELVPLSPAVIARGDRCR